MALPLFILGMFGLSLIIGGTAAALQIDPYEPGGRPVAFGAIGAGMAFDLLTLVLIVML